MKNEKDKEPKQQATNYLKYSGIGFQIAGTAVVDALGVEPQRAVDQRLAGLGCVHECSRCKKPALPRAQE